MGVSPSRSPLYSTVRRIVICLALAFVLAGTSLPQASRSPKPPKGPRALGLLELTPGGKPRLIPIAILIDGKFYDASGYKASPVPMALWAETVYEGFRTGVSEGLFTVTAALQNQVTKEWLAEGTWLPAGSIPAKTAKKQTSSIPRGLNDEEGPPVLRHGGAAAPKAPEPSATPAPSTQSSTSPSSSPQANAPASTSGSASGNPQASSGGTAAAAPSTTSTSDQEAEDDKDRPTLKRGKQPPKPQEPMTVANVTPASKTTPQAASPTKPPEPAQIQLIPAISDANGPEPHSYAYIAKPEETEQYRKRMLALASDEIRVRAKQLASETIGTQASRPAGKAGVTKQPQPSFEKTELRIFDLSSSNEPILVLSAEARMPASDLKYIITLVAREDINGDLHKAMTNVTDGQHLDVLPQLELIDAVDVDGDGRGELLFRKVSDSSSAYVIYRVIGDQLYPLFEGTL